MANDRITQQAVEALILPSPGGRTTQEVVEALIFPTDEKARFSQQAVEYVVLYIQPPAIPAATVLYTPILYPGHPAFGDFIPAGSVVLTPQLLHAITPVAIGPTSAAFEPLLRHSNVLSPFIPPETLVIPPRLVRPLVNTIAPAIVGTPIVGAVVEAYPGEWSGTTPYTYGYQWQRCDSGGGSCVSIPGATGRQYIVSPDDEAATLRVQVTVAYTGPPTAPATSAATAVISPPADPAAPPGGYLVTSGLPDVALWRFVICDRDGTYLSDVSGIASGKRLSTRLNRPAEAHAIVPANHALVNTIHTDGYPILSVGRRLLKVYRRDAPGAEYRLLHNGIIWHLEDSGDENVAKTDFTSYDPMIIWRFRPVRDSTGDFSTPTFSNPIAPGDLVQQMVRNSIEAGAGPPADSEGPLGLDWQTGQFDVSTPPGLDVMSNDLMDWPITMADMHSMLADTGGLDVWIDPVDNQGDPDVQGILNAVNAAGRFRPSVHFDYGMGDFSIRAMRRSLDMDTITNKLWYYLGPKVSADPARWKGSITGTAPYKGGTWDSEVLDVMNQSREAYGVYMSISVYDTLTDDEDDTQGENSYRPFFINLWRGEMMLRAEPREMLFVTPVRDAPFSTRDIQLGDIISVNSSDVLRYGFTNALQRVYGLDISIDDNSIEAIEELVVSPE